MILGVTGLVCLSVSQFLDIQRQYRETPEWSYTLPTETIVQIWRNELTGTSTTIYLNKMGRVCVIDIGKAKPETEKRDG